MGNQICCEEHHTQTERQGINQLAVIVQEQAQKEELIDHQDAVVEEEKIEIPDLSVEILAYLNQQKPFSDVSGENFKIVRYGEDVYEGCVDEANRPSELGKMYHKNGSFYFGKFQNGKANGFGHFIKSDGTWYRGKFVDNKANDTQGQYKSKQLYYKGGFKNNTFDGQGYEKTNLYQFDGIYQNFSKKKGTLKWKQGDEEYHYEGQLNEQGRPHGSGTMIWKKGKYQGSFVNGIKQGFGTFFFSNGLKYIGEYHNDLKEGEGKLFNTNGTISYEGQFKEGLPHGEGFASSNGQRRKCQWEQGIDKELL